MVMTMQPRTPKSFTRVPFRIDAQLDKDPFSANLVLFSLRLPCYATLSQMPNKKLCIPLFTIPVGSADPVFYDAVRIGYSKSRWLSPCLVSALLFHRLSLLFPCPFS